MTVRFPFILLLLMLGLAAGRILSFALDGWPHWLLVVYSALVLILGSIAIGLYKSHSASVELSS